VIIEVYARRRFLPKVSRDPPGAARHLVRAAIERPFIGAPTP